MSSLGGICICGAGCKKETGCRGYGRRHEMENIASATIMYGVAPVMKESMLTNERSGSEEVPGCESAVCNSDPCSG